MKIRSTVFTATFLVFFTALQAGHSPPPAPSLQSATIRKVGTDSNNNGTPNLQRQAPAYKMIKGVPVTPLERLIRDGSQLGDGTYAHKWEPVAGIFWLPHLTLNASEKIQKQLTSGKGSVKPEALFPCISTLMPAPFPEGVTGLPKNARVLIETTQRSQQPEREKAAEHLTQIRHSASEAWAITLLADSDPKIRRAMFKTLTVPRINPKLLEPVTILSIYGGSYDSWKLIKKILPDNRKGHQTYDLLKAVAKTNKSHKLLTIAAKTNSDLVALAALVKTRIDPPLWNPKSLKRWRSSQKESIKLAEKILKNNKTSRYLPLLSWLTKSLIAQINGSVPMEPGHIRLSRDSRWWVRWLAASIAGVAHGDEATALLLERQRDWNPLVRRVANQSLVSLHSISYLLSPTPDLSADSHTIHLWEQWATRRSNPKIQTHQKGNLDESKDGWVHIPLISRPRQLVFSPSGPALHNTFTGKYMGKRIHLVDHNDNGRFDEFGVDNFVIGSLRKPGNFLSRFTQINGNWFEVDLNPRKAELLLKPYIGKLGTISITTNYSKKCRVKFLVLARTIDLTVQIPINDNAIGLEMKIPTGNWQIYAGYVFKGKSQGVNAVHISSGRQPIINVQENSTHKFKLGGNFSIDANVSVNVENDKSLVVVESPRLSGQHGEIYFDTNPQLGAINVILRSLDGEVLREIEWKPSVFVTVSVGTNDNLEKDLKEQVERSYGSRQDELKKQFDDIMRKTKNGKAVLNAEFIETHEPLIINTEELPTLFTVEFTTQYFLGPVNAIPTTVNLEDTKN